MFKNLVHNLLSEAEGDDLQGTNSPEAEEAPSADGQEDAPKEDSQEESSEEEQPAEGDQPTEEEPSADGEDSSEEGGTEGLDDATEDDTEEEEEPVATGNPHARLIYFRRFTNLGSLVQEFQDRVNSSIPLYKNADETEERNRKLTNYILTNLATTAEQIDYLIVDGAATSLNLEVLQKIYAKLKTKLESLIKLYSKIVNIKL